MTSVLTAKQEAQLRQFAPDHLRVIKATMRQAKRTKTAEAKATPDEPPAELTIDLSDLQARVTLADMEDMEEASGTPGFVIFENLGSSIKGMAALIWVLQRQVDPTYTYEQARAIPMGTFLKAFRGVTAKPRPFVKRASRSG